MTDERNAKRRTAARLRRAQDKAESAVPFVILPCICCRVASVRSEHAGHRMCDDCRADSDSVAYSVPFRDDACL